MLAFEGRTPSAMERAAAALTCACDLEPDWATEICRLDPPTEFYPAGHELGPPARRPHVKWVLDGWACEARHLADGRRQIFSFVMSGDVVRPPAGAVTRTVRTLTALECVDLTELADRGAFGERVLNAITRSAALANARRYEQLTRLACRSALCRTASLLVELHGRLEAAGLAKDGEFALPLRHEELADALGLSTAHVTRCLAGLRARGLLTMQFRRVSGFDRAGLEALIRENP
jgi:CRP-like cAMP-binding protein